MFVLCCCRIENVVMHENWAVFAVKCIFVLDLDFRDFGVEVI